MNKNIKLCQDCVHYAISSGNCLHESAISSINYVNGEVDYFGAYTQRKGHCFGDCGKSGKYFDTIESLKNKTERAAFEKTLNPIERICRRIFRWRV